MINSLENSENSETKNDWVNFYADLFIEKKNQMLFVKENLARALLNDPTTSKIIYYAYFKLLYEPTKK